MDQARERLRQAQHDLGEGFLAGAVSIAYYAMLYAARAALSEDDEHARTHSGTWHLFHQRFVATGAFDEDLHVLAHRAQRTREQGDYEAVTPEPSEAKAIIEGAADFIAAVERMLNA